VKAQAAAVRQAIKHRNTAAGALQFVMGNACWAACAPTPYRDVACYTPGVGLTWVDAYADKCPEEWKRVPPRDEALARTGTAYEYALQATALLPEEEKIARALMRADSLVTHQPPMRQGQYPPLGWERVAKQARVLTDSVPAYPATWPEELPPLRPNPLAYHLLLATECTSPPQAEGALLYAYEAVSSYLDRAAGNDLALRATVRRGLTHLLGDMADAPPAAILADRGIVGGLARALLARLTIVMYWLLRTRTPHAAMPTAGEPLFRDGVPQGPAAICNALNAPSWWAQAPQSTLLFRAPGTPFVAFRGEHTRACTSLLLLHRAVVQALYDTRWARKVAPDAPLWPAVQAMAWLPFEAGVLMTAAREARLDAVLVWPVVVPDLDSAVRLESASPALVVAAGPVGGGQKYAAVATAVISRCDSGGPLLPITDVTLPRGGEHMAAVREAAGTLAALTARRPGVEVAATVELPDPQAAAQARRAGAGAVRALARRTARQKQRRLAVPPELLWAAPKTALASVTAVARHIQRVARNVLLLGDPPVMATCNALEEMLRLGQGNPVEDDGGPCPHVLPRPPAPATTKPEGGEEE